MHECPHSNIYAWRREEETIVQFSVENPKRNDSSTLVFKRLVDYGDFTAMHQSLFRTRQAKWRPEESYMCAIEFLILNFSFDFRIKLRHQRKNGCQSQVCSTFFYLHATCYTRILLCCFLSLKSYYFCDLTLSLSVTLVEIVMH